MPGQLYPLFLSLEGFSVLIIGFGSVGRRKLAMLIPTAPAAVTIIDPRGPDGEGGELIKSAGEAGISVRIFPGPFVDNMLEDVQLVYTCAGDHALNARVAGLCRERRIFCNCTDNPPLGSLHVPAAARRGTLCCALSTGGASPALARRWKKELEAWLARKERITDLMAALRPLVVPRLAVGSEPRHFPQSLGSLSRGCTRRRPLGTGRQPAQCPPSARAALTHRGITACTPSSLLKSPRF